MDLDAYLKAMEFIEALDRTYPENIDAGWLYVMRNSEFKRPLLKIGMTTRPPYNRAHELAGTGVPGRFELIYFVHVGDARLGESLAHEELAGYRYQANKEFFEVAIGRAVAVLDKVVEYVPLLRSQRNRGSRNPRSKPVPQAFSSAVRQCPRCRARNRVRTLAIPIEPKCGACSHVMPAP